MRLNYRSTNLAFLDFETQSECPLTTVHKFVSHPSTRALCLCVKVDGAMHRFGPYLDAEAKSRLANLTEGRTLVAHNAPFDHAVWEAEGLPEREWMDTLPCARAAGFPGKLDLISKAVGGRGKDPNGKRLLDLLCILRPGQRPPAVGPAHKLLMDYCAQDVEELELIHRRVARYGEPDVMQVDRDVNDRGVPIDRAWLTALIALYSENKTLQTERFNEHTEGSINPNSPKSVLEWVNSLGFHPGTESKTSEEVKPSISKQAIKDLMHSPEKFYGGEGDMADAFSIVKEALEARREVVRVGKGKAEKALECLEDDDRIRDQFVYYGAGPGRWSSRALQLHNMPTTSLVKGVDPKSLELTFDAVKSAAAKATEGNSGTLISVADVLNAMLRCMVRADNLLVADYAGVEARALAWICDEPTHLALFRDPTASVYLDMGEKLYGRRISKKEYKEYTLAKAIVLGAGYGMSGMKFAYMCKLRNTDVRILDRLGIKAEQVISIYRKTYPRIPMTWKALGDAAIACCGGCDSYAGKCHFVRDGSDMHIVLPSGRPIVYRNARIEMKVPGYALMYNTYGHVAVPVKTVVYDSSHGFPVALWGSKIAENVCQAICRDLMATTLVNAESMGLNVVLHVHDEVVCEAPEGRFEEFLEMMTCGPKWSEGFPVMAEGYTGPRWTKNTEGYREGVAMNGRML